jgi:hypothetical protein
LRTVLGLLIAILPAGAAGHGGVVLEDDVCVIRMGYLKAHFKIYLPRERGHAEYCEDLPEAAEAVFVMEYQHESLAETPIDFRIVRNETGLGRFARQEDLTALDLERITVFHQRGIIAPDVFTAVYAFDSPGEYVGIVTAHPPRVGNVSQANRVYSAVFPFKVGFTGFGFWPWLGFFAVFLFANLWVVRGRLSR